MSDDQPPRAPELPVGIDLAAVYLSGARNAEEISLRALYARLARAELEKLDARLIVVRAGVASVETELARLANSRDSRPHHT